MQITEEQPMITSMTNTWNHLSKYQVLPCPKIFAVFFFSLYQLHPSTSAPSTDPTDLTLPQTPPMERFWRSKERPPHLEWMDQWWKLGYLKNAMVYIGLPTRKIKYKNDQTWLKHFDYWFPATCSGSMPSSCCDSCFLSHSAFLEHDICRQWPPQIGDKQIQVENHLISRVNQNSSLLC